MRLAEEKIKQGILHPDPWVREAAVGYFVKSFSRDAGVMPLVIEAVETYGWQDAVLCMPGWKNLVQTRPTIEWVIETLGREPSEPAAMWKDFCGKLWRVLSAADARLLRDYEERIVDGFDDPDLDAVESVTARVRLLDADPDACWRDLEDFCEQVKGKKYINDVNIGHAYRLVEALARRGWRYAERMLAKLREKIVEYDNNPLSWMQPLVARLAGCMRMHAAVPLLLDRLDEDFDWLDEECCEALVRIGTDSVVRAIGNKFPTAIWDFRLFTSGEVLDRIHSDLAFERCLRLLEIEEDGDVLANLARAAVRHFSTDALQPARLLIQDNIDDPEFADIRSDVAAACALLEVDFPRLRQWRRAAADDYDRRKKWYDGDFQAIRDVISSPFRNLARRAPADDEYPDDEDFDDERPDGEFSADFNDAGDDVYVQPQPVVREARVGRNEPCPCGSGKKFKKCCLNK